ncbi:uncharacterized protein V3H82_010857 isoform 2-T2 [Fundulus diaphanus]
MTVALIYFFFLSLQGTNSPSVQAVKQLLRAAGEDISVTCGVTFSGTWKVFCRENCAEGNILIQTQQHAAQRERYSIKCVKDLLSDAYIFSVKISNLHESDSGLYRCGLGDSLSSVIYQDFRLVVPKAKTSSTSTPTTRQSLSSTHRLSFTPLVSSRTTQSVLTKENTTSSQFTSSHYSSSQTSANVWLFVLPILGIIVFLLSVTLVVFCIRRLKKAETASTVEMEPFPAYESFRNGEDIREEEEPRKSSDMEIYLAYIDTLGSSVSAATCQNKAPCDDYANVKFSSRSSFSPHRAGNDNTTDVVYSGCEQEDPSTDKLLYSNIF